MVRDKMNAAWNTGNLGIYATFISPRTIQRVGRKNRPTSWLFGCRAVGYGGEPLARPQRHGNSSTVGAAAVFDAAGVQYSMSFVRNDNFVGLLNPRSSDLVVVVQRGRHFVGAVGNGRGSVVDDLVDSRTTTGWFARLRHRADLCRRRVTCHIDRLGFSALMKM